MQPVINFHLHTQSALDGAIPPNEPVVLPTTPSRPRLEVYTGGYAGPPYPTTPTSTSTSTSTAASSPASSLQSSGGPSYAQSSYPPSPVDDTAVVRGALAHGPYARLHLKKQGTGKRRKMWNHALEKSLFSPQEISSMGAPHRRTIYAASLEAHIDRLHEQLNQCGDSFQAASGAELRPYHGLNAKTAKYGFGLHHDWQDIKMMLLELDRANDQLRNKLGIPYKQ